MDKFTGKLIAHGAAPFNHDPKQSQNYYAVLQGDDGKENTVWGVDIDRSLSEAGVQIGDSISLIRGGKQPVTIQVKNEHGHLEDQVVDRNIWQTEVHAKNNDLPIDDDELTVSPSRERKIDIAEDEAAKKAAAMQVEGADEQGRDDVWAVMAPYWLDGLHNHKGIALAEKLNERIAKNGLAGNEKGIREMLEAEEGARALVLDVVKRQRYLDDKHLKRNVAEPGLLKGMFVRDEKGGYHPVAGGPVVLADKGDSLVLKGKTKEAYEAAIELAVAKGWTSIELKGKPAMMAGVWLEAKMLGIEVVNYQPTEKDKDALAAKIAERDAKLAADKALEGAAEQVELREFVGADGASHEARVTYTVSYDDAGVLMADTFDNPKQAAEAFAALPVKTEPTVLRTVLRLDNTIISSSFLARSDALPGQSPEKSVKLGMDQEFADAFDLAVEAERARAEAARVVPDVMKDGPITGKILDIKDGIVYQSRGRDVVVKHALSELKGVPVKGEMMTINFRNGRGLVEDRSLGHEKGGIELSR